MSLQGAMAVQRPSVQSRYSEDKVHSLITGSALESQPDGDRQPWDGVEQRSGTDLHRNGEMSKGCYMI